MRFFFLCALYLRCFIFIYVAPCLWVCGLCVLCEWNAEQIKRTARRKIGITIASYARRNANTMNRTKKMEQRSKKELLAFINYLWNTNNAVGVMRSRANGNGIEKTQSSETSEKKIALLVCVLLPCTGYCVCSWVRYTHSDDQFVSLEII